MPSSEVDARHYARQRLLVPVLAFGGVLLALMALVYWDDNWALNTGLVLAGVECLIASYVIHRSARRGRDVPEKIRRLILALSGVVVLLLIIALFL